MGSALRCDGMKTSILFLFSMALSIAPAHSQEVSQDAIGDARRAIGDDADFDAARQFLDAFESYALEATPPVSSEKIADMNFLLGVLEFYLNQDEEAARSRWLWTLQINEEYPWDSELVGGAGEGVFEEVRKTVTSTHFFSIVPAGKQKQRPMFLDGQVVSERTNVLPGQHLVQAKCSDGKIRGVYVYLSPGSEVVCPCPLDACFERGSKKSKGRSKKAKKKGRDSAIGLSFGNWRMSSDTLEATTVWNPSPLLGGTWSVRRDNRMRVVDFGAYISASENERSNGVYGSFAYNWLRPSQGLVEFYVGVNGLLMFADDRDFLDSDTFELWSGFVGGVHGGLLRTSEAGGQLGLQVGWSPLYVVGEMGLYDSIVSQFFFRRAF